MSSAEAYESLGKCVEALKLGSPPPTVRKRISLKLKPAPPSPPPIRLPQCEDVSFEASLPILEIDTAQPKITTAEIGSSVKPKRPIRMKKKRSDQLLKLAEVPSEVSTEEESIIGSIIRAIFDESSDLPPPNQWVRPIDFDGQIMWKDYPKKEQFKRVAWIVPDLAVVEEPTESGKGKRKP